MTYIVEVFLSGLVYIRGEGRSAVGLVVAPGVCPGVVVVAFPGEFPLRFLPQFSSNWRQLSLQHLCAGGISDLRAAHLRELIASGPAF